MLCSAGAVKESEVELLEVAEAVAEVNVQVTSLGIRCACVPEW